MVEILGRRGQVDQRFRIERFPATVGRAYTNDLILDDRHICAEHARLELSEEGAVILRDLDSVNGIHRMDGGERVRIIEVTRGAEVRMGRTRLRFLPPDKPVAATVPNRESHPIWVWATSHWTAVLAWLAVFAGASAWTTYRSSYAELEADTLLTQLSYVLLAMLGWAGGWALFGRLLIHRTRFTGHWAVVCVYGLASLFLEGAFGYVRFLFAPVVAVTRVEFVGEGLLLAGLLYLHLHLATALRLRARTLVFVAAVVLSVAFSELNRRQTAKWMQTLPYWSRLQPVPQVWLPVESSEAFFTAARTLGSELDALAEEELADRAIQEGPL